MTAIVVRNALVVGANPALGDVVVVDGRIAAVGTALDAPAGAKVIDATGCWVGPGLVDLHAHLREPGDEAAETIESGARAAALGGFCAVMAMPNTEPSLDNVALVAHVLDRGSRCVVDVAVAGAITVGREGERLAPMAEMAALGVALFTDDGRGVQSPAVMRRALQYSAALGVRLAQHCEDESLVGAGVMNEGALSGRLGLEGRPALAEELMVMRDVELVGLTGGAVHFQHLSTARSVEIVVMARARGLDVTCEVTPHHLTLDESACSTYDPTFKVNPPLRTIGDVEGLRLALRTGLIDAVATDHAPHSPESKDLPFDDAPAGVLGLEHAASLTLDALGGLNADPSLFFDVLSRRPARVARLDAGHSRSRRGAHGGSLSPGDDAHLVVFDPVERWRADRDRLASRATNTPYHGRELTGRVRATIVNGRLVVDNGALA
ncbi:MAG: dihydroorotase [Acidimicrobiales bacterium]